jgi:Holliday junction resolvasome RuvABC endonuclease subunit
MKVLALDPAYRNFGYVVFHKADDASDFVPIKARVIRAAVLNTKERKAHKKRTKDELLKTDNGVNACREIFAELRLLLTLDRPDIVLSERLGGSQDYSSARGFGYSDGILACLIELAGVPCYRYTNTKIKHAFTGNRGADKDEMILEAARRYPTFVEQWFPASNQTKTGYQDICEHMADACGVMVMAEQDPKFSKFVEEYYVSSTE